MAEEAKKPRYLLFAGSTYYPAGGWGDYRGAFETIKEATEAGDGFDWLDVVDLETLDFVPDPPPQT